MFTADSKQRLEMAVGNLSMEKFQQELSSAFCCKANIKIYYFDGVDVMPVAGEHDLKYFLDRFLDNYTSFDNHADINRVYIVVPEYKENSANNVCTDDGGKIKEGRSKKPHSPATAQEGKEKFAARIKERFPDIELIEGKKFRCRKCGKIRALNGNNRVSNIIRHINTVCMSRGKQGTQSIVNFFQKK